MTAPARKDPTRRPARRRVGAEDRGDGGPGMRTLAAVQERLRQFARERDWEQFHSPKNLASALIVEAAELLEHFQWLTQRQSRRLSPAQQRAVTLEMADVFLYLLRLADLLGVDLLEAAACKIELNDRKYPAAEVRGRADKR